jgi:hypothetical protein
MTFAVKVAPKPRPAKYQNLVYNLGTENQRWMS